MPRKTRSTQRELCASGEAGSDNRIQLPTSNDTLQARKQTTFSPLVVDNVERVADSNIIVQPLAAQQAKASSSGQKRKNMSADKTPKSSKTKRCCKRDLKLCLHVGDLIENIRVDPDTLREKNGNQRLLAEFDGENFIDCYTNESFRSISDWVKKRMVSMVIISPKSNISGWDYTVVHRDGTKVALRLLVENTKKKMERMRQGVGAGTGTLSASSNSGSASTSPNENFESKDQLSRSVDHSILAQKTSASFPSSLRPFVPPSFGVGQTFASKVHQETNSQSDFTIHERLQKARAEASALEKILIDRGL